MNKTNRILIGLFLLQIVLILGMGLSKEETAVTQATKVFEGFDPAKVTHIKIYGEVKESTDATPPAPQTIELHKDGTTWGVVGADNYPADGTKVQEFLDKIAKLKTRGEVLKKATYHKKLEVAEDRYQRQIVLTHDNKEIRFFIGSSPSFKNVHLRKAGSDEVVQAGDLSSWEVGARGWDWVNRDYVKIPDKDLWGVAITNKSGSMRLDKDAYGNWAVSGVHEPLKKAMIDDIVRKAATINLEEPIGKTEKPEYGLADPTATITLTIGTSTVSGKMPDETKTEVVRLGAKIDKDNRYYAKSTTSPFVVTVASWAVDPFVSKSTKDLVEEKKADVKKAEPKKADAKKPEPKKTK